MRLIDADALDKAFTDLRWSSEQTLAHWGDRKDWCLHGSEIEKLIEDAPTIDPVKHGRWRKKWFALARTEIAYCSVCSKGTVWAFAYCPNCGAMMDEEADHDDHL